MNESGPEKPSPLNIDGSQNLDHRALPTVANEESVLTNDAVVERPFPSSYAEVDPQVYPKRQRGRREQLFGTTCH